MILYFSDICTLIKITEGKNSFGANVNSKTIKSEVYCNKRSLSQTENYQLSKLGFKGELKIEIYEVDFEDGTEFVEYEKVKYKIQRLYPIGDKIELTCVKAVV